MNQEILQRLDALAAKLGVTATHLWAVLVRQAYVEFATSVAFAVIIAIATYGFVRVVRHGIAQEWYDDYDGLPQIFTGIVGIVLGVCWLVALVGVVQGIGYLINPEYFALHEVIKALGGGK